MSTAHHSTHGSSRPDHATTRRDFLKQAGQVSTGCWAAGALLSGAAAQGVPSTAAAAGRAKPATAERLALDGGPKAVTAATADATKWPLYGDEEIALVSELLRSPNYEPIAEFEKAWCEYHGCQYAKAHCNGTSALTSMLFALELPEGSEILVPDYSTWFPVVPMRLFGLVPVFTDVDPQTMNIDVASCEKALTPRTRAVLAVHWYGLPCDLDDLADFCERKGLILLEDASHAHGSRVKDRLIGTWGRMAGFSLQMTKPLPAIEGGIGMYKDRGDYERAVTYGNYDLPRTFPEDSPYRKYQGTALGSKLRMHPVSAILARIQLRDLDRRNAEGVAQVRALNDRLTQLPGIVEPRLRKDVARVYYSKNLLFIDEKKAGVSREVLVKALQAEGVDITPYTWTLLHTYPIFREEKWWRHMPVLPESVPNCDRINQSLVQLPYFTSPQPELIEQYAAAFEKVWAHRKKLA